MDTQVSKNIIIILLAGLVFGLLGIIYLTSTDDDASDSLKDTITVEESTIETKEASNVEKNAPQTTDTLGIPEKTVLPIPIVTRPSQIDLSKIELEQGVVIVTYTDSGFIPPVVEVRAGDSVTFINSSSKPMWVTSENHPTAKAQVYPGFAQAKSVSKGGTYTFSFTQVGVWGYKNLNLEKHLGAISVIAQ